MSRSRRCLRGAVIAADAGAPGGVRIPAQERLYEELAAKTLNIDLPAEAPTDVNPMATLGHFIGEGILHIFTGYDHMAFIVTLILSLRLWREVALIVTAFTAAHSVSSPSRRSTS